jgi:hypothetical protein
LPLGAAQDRAAKTSAPPSEVEVRFLDGSTVRMVVIQEGVEVETRYGKLTIPTTDIRRIEFGFRLSDEANRKIGEAVKDLGSNAYGKRNAASRILVEYGALAFPAVKGVAKSPDLEVAKRAQEVLRLIREKVPEERLRFRTDDLIQTAEFPITGRIISPSLKARSAYFGEQQLKMTEMRSIRWLAGVNEVEFTVDAAKCSNAEQWLDTGIELEAGGLVIAASGQVDLYPIGAELGMYLSGPTGLKTVNRGTQHSPGALLGRVGENGKVFAIGDRYEGTTTQEGRLFVHINPSPWRNASSGSYRIKVSAGQSMASQE